MNFVALHLRGTNISFEKKKKPWKVVIHSENVDLHVPLEAYMQYKLCHTYHAIDLFIDYKINFEMGLQNT